MPRWHEKSMPVARLTAACMGHCSAYVFQPRLPSAACGLFFLNVFAPGCQIFTKSVMDVLFAFVIFIVAPRAASSKLLK